MLISPSVPRLSLAEPITTLLSPVFSTEGPTTTEFPLVSVFDVLESPIVTESPSTPVAVYACAETEFINKLITSRNKIMRDLRNIRLHNGGG